jgi:hypothetical protein
MNVVSLPAAFSKDDTSSRIVIAGVVLAGVVLPGALLMAVGAPQPLVLPLVFITSIALPWLVGRTRSSSRVVLVSAPRWPSSPDAFWHPVDLSVALQYRELAERAQYFHELVRLDRGSPSADWRRRRIAEILFVRWIAKYDHLRAPEDWLRSVVLRDAAFLEKDLERNTVARWHRHTHVSELDALVMQLIERRQSAALAQVQTEFLNYLAIQIRNLPLRDRMMVKVVYDLRSRRNDEPDDLSLRRAARFITKWFRPLTLVQPRLALLEAPPDLLEAN